MAHTYLFVHGAWQGKWAWENILSRLAQQGIEAHALDLPGCGEDNTPAAQATFESYVERIRQQAQALKEQGKKITLVAHSMGGASATATVAAYPELFEKVIYVCAFVPQNGQTIGGLLGESASFGVAGPAMEINESELVATLVQEKIAEGFFHDCTEKSQYEHVLSKFRPQPILPLGAEISVPTAFANVEKHYILCELDRAIAPKLQEKMAQQANIQDVRRLPAGHEPFFSMPDKLLAEILAC